MTPLPRFILKYSRLLQAFIDKMAKIKVSLFFVIFSLFTIEKTASQSAFCVYSTTYGYTCKLTLKNVDENTPINGDHIAGIKDENVQNIDASGKSSNSLQIPSNLCQKFKNTEDMNLESVGLVKIAENSFQSCKYLEVLSLSDNKIEKLPEKIFAGQPKLNRLNLSNNNLTELDAQLFTNLKNLKILELRSNQLKTLPEGIFSSLLSLEQLSLNLNQLKTLAYSSFGSAADKLQTFDFSDNKIISIDERIFDHNQDTRVTAENNPCTAFGYNSDTGTRIYLANCFIHYEIFTTLDTKITEHARLIDILTAENQNLRAELQETVGEVSRLTEVISEMDKKVQKPERYY